MFFNPPKKTMEPQQGYPVGILLDWCLEQSKRLLCGPLVSQPPPEAPKRTGGASQGGYQVVMWLARLAIFFVAPGHFTYGNWLPLRRNGIDLPLAATDHGTCLLAHRNRGISGCTNGWLNG